ncbi:MAG: hypothetical protein WBA41_12865 [Rivularia sp. (in: cyanobacteria)]
MTLNNKDKKSNSTSTKTKSAKRTWVQIAVMVVKRIFKWLRQLLTVLYEIMQEALNTAVFLFSIALKFMSAPTTPCLLAIFVFGVVMTVTSWQWYGLGAWFAQLLGITDNLNVLSVGAGVAGVVVGLVLNVFQLGSEMWKISRRFATYYADKNVDPDFEESPEDAGVKKRLTNWLNHDHSNLKKFRKLTYIIETGLMIGYTLIANMDFWGLILGVVALFAPEASMKLVSSTISLLGGVSDHEPEQPPEEYEF